ncbi:amidohydrolase family protein [Burkholderiales bacterium]|nr:amidohydrolase family protein [Burkholderiales bacterium]
MSSHKFNTIIKGATIYNGTGEDSYRADVGICGEKIVAIGDLNSDGANIIDARGLSLMPGIIDVHTHYDAQITWDPTLSPSPSMGVTTAVMGNCGFGIAPCPPERQEIMLKNLSVVEGMNLKTLLEGTQWKFESFPDYLKYIDQQRPHANVAVLVGHSAIRTAVMGDDSSVRIKPTEEELDAMRAIVDDALLHGAIGFASSFSPNHSGYEGRPMPSTIAEDEELYALLEPIKKRKGVFVTAGGQRATPEYLEHVSKTFDCPTFLVSVLAMHNDSDPSASTDYYRRCEQALDRGREVYIHANPHPLSFDFTLRNPYIFYAHEAFNAVKLASPEQLVSIYQSPKFRNEFKHNLSERKIGAIFNGAWDKIELNEIPITKLAKKANQEPLDWLFDQPLDAQFVGKMYQNNDEGVGKLLSHRNAIIALSDAGAHVEFLCDAGFGLYFLQHWVNKTETFSLENAVEKLTSDPAAKYRIKERGRIKEGYYADLVLFDPKSIGISKLFKLDDLPGEGSRLMRKPNGIHSVWVNGTKVIDKENTQTSQEGPGHVLTEFDF